MSRSATAGRHAQHDPSQRRSIMRASRGSSSSTTSRPRGGARRRRRRLRADRTGDDQFRHDPAGRRLPSPRCAQLTRRTGTLLDHRRDPHDLHGPGGYTRAARPGARCHRRRQGDRAAACRSGVFGVSRPRSPSGCGSSCPGQSAALRQSAHLGIGGTLAGNALTVAAMRAVLEQVLTAAAFDRMIGVAEHLAARMRAVIARHALPWHVTQIGARVEIMFAAEAAAQRRRRRARTRRRARDAAARATS